jgi:hypothetical protein
MKALLALLLTANGVAWAVAQGTIVPGTWLGVAQFGRKAVSGAPLTVITKSLKTRQGR